jgi:hypothetical protein
MTDVAELKHAVLDLDAREREEILEAVLASLDHADAIDRAWIEEAHRRFEAIRSGRARVLEHEEVVARFQARFG